MPAGGLATAANDVALARPEELVDLARRSGRFDDYEVSHRTPASVTDPGRAQASAGPPGSRSGTAAAKRRKRGARTDTCKCYVFAFISLFYLAIQYYGLLPWTQSCRGTREVYSQHLQCVNILTAARCTIHGAVSTCSFVSRTLSSIGHGPEVSRGESPLHASRNTVRPGGSAWCSQAPPSIDLLPNPMSGRGCGETDHDQAPSPTHRGGSHPAPVTARPALRRR